MKKLKDPKDSVRQFLKVADVLDEKLGPLLFQLPPRWRVDVERLDGFLAALPANRRRALEFRDESWFVPEVLDLLARHGAAFCVYDLAGRRSPIEITADFVYVLLHGPHQAYRGSYDGRTLFGWVRRFLGWRDGGRDVYCFFDNDEKGFAALDALRMKDMLAER
jgi:uncharacterized protein YecE (DUF72 family)